MPNTATPGYAHWLKRHIPTRETIHRYRLLRPFARHLSDPALWRLTRRSVPRAVALGLGVGVIIPVMHIAIAAILAIPARANVMIAAAVPLALTPFYPPLYYTAYHIGSWELHHDSTLLNPATAAQFSSELSQTMFWIHKASGPIALGVLTIALAVAVVGYGISALLWRWRLSSKWRRRRHLREVR